MLDELVYSYHRGEWLDVLRVMGPEQAIAGRFLTGSVLSGLPEASWLRTGHLDHVLDELEELPPPDAPLAPRLLLSKLALLGRL